ncbi:ArsR/SmtB family transcription factor [Streptomyces lavendulocolor]|uniref:ArsR/SmtB family transcription factor n=1 Tax=Streptomyces lavendulocolor TaxID=67316 RepID=UPI0034004A74
MIDLFTVVGPAASMAEATDRLLGAPPTLVRRELDPVPRGQPPRPAWLTGQPHDGSLGRLARALTDLHDVAVAPYWPQASGALHSHAHLLGRLMASAGVQAALESLAPTLRWRPPMLEVPSYSAFRRLEQQEFDLAGRGLVLAPSLFCGREPALFVPEGDEAALLIYPIPRDAASLRGIWSPAQSAKTDKALAALLGSTRAALLAELVQGGTTSELARRLSISPASASQHTSVLRRAGLATSVRFRNTVHHSLTVQGRALLKGTTSASD